MISYAKTNILKALPWMLGVGFFLHILCILVLSSVPPISRDALVHHLTIPKMYLLHGGIYEIPSMFFSYFPMNLDLLYLVPIYFKFDIAAKYIHFSFALMTAWLLYTYLKEILNRNYGLLGALLFLTIPIIVKLSITVYVDLGLIFFSWSCLFFILKWETKDFKSVYLVLAGVFCGLALGTKYNGLIILVILTPMIAILFSSRKNRNVRNEDKNELNKNSFRGLLWATGFVLIALIVFSPWMIRNSIWKGNPVYPLYNNFFNPAEGKEKCDLVEEKQPHNAFWLRRHVYGESFFQTITIPLRAFFQGQDDNPKYFDGKLNPLLLFFLLLAFLPMRVGIPESMRRHAYFLFIFAFLFILFVLFKSDFRIRYMAPAIPPIVCLSVFGIRNIFQIVSQLKGNKEIFGVVILCTGVFFLFAYNIDYEYRQFSYVNPFDYLSKSVDRDSYISRYRKEQQAIIKANQILPKEAKVLCLSLGDRTYYLDRDAHLAGDFYKKTNCTYNEEDLYEKLTRYQTTHVLIDKDVFLNWVKSQPMEVRNIYFDVLNKYTRLLFEINGVRLLKIRSFD